MNRFLYLLLITLVFTSPLLANTSNAASSQNHSLKSIWPGAYFLKDQKQLLTPEKLVQRFSDNSLEASQFKTSKSAPMLEFVKGNVWVVIPIISDRVEPQLEVSFPHLSALDVFVKNKSGKQVHRQTNLVGDAFKNNEVAFHYPSVQLPNLNSGDVVLLRIESNHPLRLPIQMGSEAEFDQQRFTHMAIVFLCLGILLALCVYNFIIYFATGFIYYLFYCLNLVFLLVFFPLDLGLGRYFLDAGHWLNDINAWVLSVCLAFAMAILFARSFLRLPQHYPKWNLFYWFLIALVVIDIMVILAGQFEVGMGLYMVASGFYQVGVISSAIYVLRQGFKPARFFLLAWIFLALGGMLYMWTLTGLISDSLVGQYSFLIGSVIEAILLSWALAELINKIKNDQIESERHYRGILNKTSKRLADALELAGKHKKVRDVFLKQISHELKTPINAIDHVLENARAGYELKPEHIEDAFHSSRLVSRHIDKLLLNTEMSVSDPEFQQEHYDIKLLLKNWNDDFAKECESKNIQFSFSSNLSEWHRLHGPVRPLYIIMTEIIFNVCQQDMKSIDVSLKLNELTKELSFDFKLETNMVWQVATAEQMFVNPQDAFFTSDLIKLLSGHWKLEMVSPCFEGQVVLPNFSASLKDLNEQLPKRVLVVEDNKVNQTVIVSMLKRMGIDFDIANHGEEALEQQQANPADVILMDCQMPVLDGFDTTVAIRRQHSRYGNPVIIAVSANSMEKDKTHCFTVGMDDFIAKPVRMDELRNILMRWSR